jgi:hypothetical protein
MIQAPSVPGCSGCPLFDCDENLCLIVHGDSKHRGREKQRKHAAAGGDFDASSRVYADLLKVREFFLVLRSLRLCKALRMAEDVDLAWIGDSESIVDSALFQIWKARMAFLFFKGNLEEWTTVFEPYLNTMQTNSVQEIMMCLAEAIWSLPVEAISPQQGAVPADEAISPQQGALPNISFTEKENITCMCPNEETGYYFIN